MMDERLLPDARVAVDAACIVRGDRVLDVATGTSHLDPKRTLQWSEKKAVSSPHVGAHSRSDAKSLHKISTYEGSADSDIGSWSSQYG